MRYDYLLYERYFILHIVVIIIILIYMGMSCRDAYQHACIHSALSILSACMFGLSCCTFCPMLSIDVLLQTKSPLGDNKKLYLLTYLKYTNNCIVIMINMSGPLRLHVYKQTGKHTQTRKLCAAL